MSCRVVTMAWFAGFLIATVARPAVAQESGLVAVAKGSLTTSSEIFLNPDASDPVARSASFTINETFGYGVELKYMLPESHLAIGVSADYIRASGRNDLAVYPLRSVPVEDGYRVIPVELTGYFLIPASGPTVGIYMGGGAGVYIGERLYRFGGVDAPSTKTGTGFGIHVLGGVSVRLAQRFSVLAEMKFRDLQFQTTNRFNTSQIRYGGALITVSQEPFDSSVHTDGIVFQLGAAFNL